MQQQKYKYLRSSNHFHSFFTFLLTFTFCLSHRYLNQRLFFLSYPLSSWTLSCVRTMYTLAWYSPAIRLRVSTDWSLYPDLSWGLCQFGSSSQWIFVVEFIVVGFVWSIVSANLKSTNKLHLPCHWSHFRHLGK